MKLFDLNLEAATLYANSHPNYGKQFTAPNPGDPPQWCVWESQAEYDAHNQPVTPEPEPRWVSSADFVRRFMDAEWETINRKIAGNGADPDAVLARLKDKVMTGDPANPGYVNLDAAELSDGLDYVVSIGIIDADRKAELLA